MNRLACMLILAANLTAALPLTLAAAERAPEEEAGTAYRQGQFETSGRLFLRAARASPERAATHAYNAACAFARAGQPDHAFDALDLAIHHGLHDAAGLASDEDLASLRGLPRWPALVQRVQVLESTAKAAVTIMSDHSLPLATRILAAHSAAKRAPELLANPNSLFAQLFSNMAAFGGEYELAGRTYLRVNSDAYSLDGGDHAEVDGPAALLRATASRKAVFFNESHALPISRVVVASMLAPLRAQGFDTLAVEALSVVPAPAGSSCAISELSDAGLAFRGHPVGDTGYYINEPVFADLVTRAIALGYRVVAYETAGGPEETQQAREAGMARNLGCLFKERPGTRLVALAGFGHISELDTFMGQKGGAMARHFKDASGIDPLSVDTTLFAGRPSLAPGAAFRVFQAADGTLVGAPDRGYDVVATVGGSASRSDARDSWLSLGGGRRAARVEPRACGAARPCVVEAVDAASSDLRVAGDRCTLQPGEDGCTLFLRPGSYRIRGTSELGSRSERRILRVER
jgi:hypothetical protein